MLYVYPVVGWLLVVVRVRFISEKYSTKIYLSKKYFTKKSIEAVSDLAVVTLMTLMALMTLFCRSIPPEFLRSFFLFVGSRFRSMYESRIQNHWCDSGGWRF